MELVGRWPYPEEEDYRRFYPRRESWMYFRSRGVIMDDQLILGLGIQPEERPGDDADSKGVGAKDLPDARRREDQYLQQNPDRSSASSPADTEATHTDPSSGHQDHTLGLEIYDDNNPSEYGPST
jgi:hypothetical protein